MNFYFVDWKNAESAARYNCLAARYPNVYKINITDTLSDTIKICARLSDSLYFWVVSSLTNYDNFEFDNYNEVGCEPYTQVFGAETWFVNKTATLALSANYEYVEGFPNLHFVQTDLTSDQPLLDIVYISNGEPDAEKHYQTLLESVKTDNKIHRITGINGRTAAYKAAAAASNTAWFFAVFAKLEVQHNFDWTWHPDTIKGPLHYIFYARNPVTGLIYGHMSMIAYNKRSTLATNYTGLDFTLSKPHDVVPKISGIARYDQDPIVTWRTAFRECIKLKAANTKEDLQKLEVWITVGRGEFGDWSRAGARDAVEYYDSVNGEQAPLMLSYEWAWLDQYFKKKYNQ
jgi:hypothetical protein